MKPPSLLVHQPYTCVSLRRPVEHGNLCDWIIDNVFVTEILLSDSRCKQMTSQTQNNRKEFLTRIKEEEAKRNSQGW